MIKRFCFANVISILLDNTQPNAFNIDNFYLTLFNWIYNDEDLPRRIQQSDHSTISKRVHGKIEFTTDFLDVCSMDFAQDRTARCIEEHIIKKIPDFPVTASKIKSLIKEAPNLSAEKKKELLFIDDDNKSEYLAEIILSSLQFRNMPTETESPDYNGTISNCNLPAIPFTVHGRDTIIKEIYAHFIEKPSDPLFLTGTPGIGKTIVALHYGHTYKYEYSNIIYLKYESSLRHTITSISMADDKLVVPKFSDNSKSQASDNKEALFNSHLEWLRKTTPSTLIILDNMDVLPENEPLYSTFMNLPCNKLITSRLRQEIFAYREIEQMDPVSAIALFKEHYTAGDLSDDQISELVELVYRHTMTVEIMAKTMLNSGLTYDDTVEALRYSVHDLAPDTKSLIYKDDKCTHEIVSTHLKTLFDLGKLTPSEQRLLFFFSFLPTSGITRKRLQEYSSDASNENIDKLYRLGWIQQDYPLHKVYLHPLIAETCQKEFSFSYEEMKESFHNIFDSTKNNMDAESKKYDDEELTSIILQLLKYTSFWSEERDWLKSIYSCATYASNCGYVTSALETLSVIEQNINQLYKSDYYFVAELFLQQSVLNQMIGQYELALKSACKSITCLNLIITKLPDDDIYTKRFLRESFTRQNMYSILEGILCLAHLGKENEALQFLESLQKNIVTYMPNKSRLLYKKAEIHLINNNYQSALHSIKECIEIRKEEFGPDSIETAYAIAKMGSILELTENYSDAYSAYALVRDIFINKYTDSHINVKSCEVKLLELWSKITSTSIDTEVYTSYLDGKITYTDIIAHYDSLISKIRIYNKTHSKYTENESTIKLIESIKNSLARQQKKRSERDTPLLTILQNNYPTGLDNGILYQMKTMTLRNYSSGEIEFYTKQIEQIEEQLISLSQNIDGPIDLSFLNEKFDFKHAWDTIHNRDIRWIDYFDDNENPPT